MPDLRHGSGAHGCAAEGCGQLLAGVVFDALVRSFPVPAVWEAVDWSGLSDELANRMEADAVRKTINTRQGHVIEYDEISAAKSKNVIDAIDNKLAEIYCLEDSQLDFIRNYDIKYRLAGADEVDAGDDG